jgi:hypothetical protein
MTVALITVMVKIPAAEIRPVLPFKTGVIVSIIYLITIMPMPPGIAVIGITGIIPFKIDLYMHLRRSRAGYKASGDDHG